MVTQSNTSNLIWAPIVRNTMVISNQASPPAPDASLHIWTGSAGSVASRWALGLVIEDDAINESGFQFLGPNTAVREIAWGGPTDGNYYHAISGYNSSHATSPSAMGIRVAGVQQLMWTSGVLTFQLATSITNVTTHKGTGGANVIHWANLAATDATARRWQVQMLDPATDTFYNALQVVPKAATPLFTFAGSDYVPTTSELDADHFYVGYTKATNTATLYMNEGGSIVSLVLGVMV